MLNTKDLENNRTDHLVTIAKSALGLVPFAGSILAEITGNIIPNQRMDRLVKYVKLLDEKLSKIPIDVLNNLLNNDEFVDLIEEGFVQASRALTDERRQYIASIISNGILDDNIELAESKYFLKLIQELNDIEIIWLCYYGNEFDKRTEFYEKHKNVLKEIIVYLGDEKEIANKAAIQKSYIDHLARLKLVVHKFRTDKSTGSPKYKSSGEPEISGTNITTLGKLLLKQMDLIEEGKK